MSIDTNVVSYLCASNRVGELEEKGYKIRKLKEEELRGKMGTSSRAVYREGKLVYMEKKVG